VSRPRVSLSEITARASPGPVEELVRRATNERSILRMSIGKRCRYESEE
jgi:hypothetical protein